MANLLRNLSMAFASVVIVAAGAFAQETGDRGLTVTRAAGASLPTGDYRLLVIGIDAYARLPRLKTAVADAKAITQVLQERYGFTGERTTSLFNTDATASNILRALRDLAKQLTPNDSLLIYYAGHGHVDEITQTGSWLPVGADPKDPSTWIDNSKIKAYVRAMKARHVFLISDSCFSGDFFRSSRAALPEITDAYVRKAFARTSREAITSGGLEPVSDAGLGRHSVFAHFLLKTLKENAEAYLLPAAIHERVKGGVAANARQQTQHGTLTGTGGEVGGSFVLFLKGTGGMANLDRMIEEKKRRMSLLERREAEARAASRAQAAELTKREKAIAELDTKIAAMRRRLGPVDAPDDASTLDNIHAAVKEKERQQEELEEMRRRVEEEKKAREAELERLRQEENQKKDLALKADLAKYREIASSEFGKEMKQQAWAAILTKWGIEEGRIRVGDVSGLRKALGIPAPIRRRRRKHYKTADVEPGVISKGDSRFGVRIGVALPSTGRDQDSNAGALVGLSYRLKGLDDSRRAYEVGLNVATTTEVGRYSSWPLSGHVNALVRAGRFGPREEFEAILLMGGAGYVEFVEDTGTGGRYVNFAGSVQFGAGISFLEDRMDVRATYGVFLGSENLEGLGRLSVGYRF